MCSRICIFDWDVKFALFDFDNLKSSIRQIESHVWKKGMSDLTFLLLRRFGSSEFSKFVKLFFGSRWDCVLIQPVQSTIVLFSFFSLALETGSKAESVAASFQVIQKQNVIRTLESHVSLTWLLTATLLSLQASNLKPKSSSLIRRSRKCVQFSPNLASSVVPCWISQAE